MSRRSGLAELLMGGLALVFALAIFVALLVFSLVAFAVVAMAALLLFGYVWWKARRARASGGGAPNVSRKGPL